MDKKRKAKDSDSPSHDGSTTTANVNATSKKRPTKYRKIVYGLTREQIREMQVSLDTVAYLYIEEERKAKSDVGNNGKRKKKTVERGLTERLVKKLQESPYLRDATRDTLRNRVRKIKKVEENIRNIANGVENEGDERWSELEELERKADTVSAACPSWKGTTSDRLEAATTWAATELISLQVQAKQNNKKVPRGTLEHLCETAGEHWSLNCVKQETVKTRAKRRNPNGRQISPNNTKKKYPRPNRAREGGDDGGGGGEEDEDCVAEEVLLVQQHYFGKSKPLDDETFEEVANAKDKLGNNISVEFGRNEDDKDPSLNALLTGKQGPCLFNAKEDGATTGQEESCIHNSTIRGHKAHQARNMDSMDYDTSLPTPTGNQAAGLSVFNCGLSDQQEDHLGKTQQLQATEAQLEQQLLDEAKASVGLLGLTPDLHLTEAEKASPIGGAMEHLLGMISSLKKELMASRGVTPTVTVVEEELPPVLPVLSKEERKSLLGTSIIQIFDAYSSLKDHVMSKRLTQLMKGMGSHKKRSPSTLMPLNDPTPKDAPGLGTTTAQKGHSAAAAAAAAATASPTDAAVSPSNHRRHEESLFHLLSPNHHQEDHGSPQQSTSGHHCSKRPPPGNGDDNIVKPAATGGDGMKKVDTGGGGRNNHDDLWNAADLMTEQELDEFLMND